MKIEYILYLAVIIIIASFFSLAYIFIEYIKRNIVNKKVRLFLQSAHIKIDYDEAKERLAYVVKYRKYISSDLHKESVARIKYSMRVID